MDEKEIQKILKTHDQSIRLIHDKIRQLTDEAMAEIAYAEAAYPSIEYGKTGHTSNQSDLADVLERARKISEHHADELRTMIQRLSEEEQRIQRVWACFHVLEDPHFTILEELYVKGELYEVTESKFEISHKTFEKHRKDGIEMINLLFESDASVPDLTHRYRRLVSRSYRHTEKKRKVPKQEPAEQMSIFDVIGDKK